MKSLRNIQLKLLASMMYVQHRFSLILCRQFANRMFAKQQYFTIYQIERTERIKRIERIERIENMHELGVVFHIIDDLKEVAVDNEITEITKVVLELGEVSTVIDSYLTDCWKWAIKKEELLKDSELVIEKINAVTYCEDCKSEYETVKYGKICPKCGSRHTYLLRGSEFNIKEIEAC